MSNTIFIKGEDLIPGDIYYVEKIIDNVEKVLIKGTIYDMNNNVVSGSCVEIIQILGDSFSTEGYVFSNLQGQYGFVIDYVANADYRLKVYSPINP